MGSDTVLRELGDFKRTTYAFLKKGGFTPRAVALFLDVLEGVARLC